MTLQHLIYVYFASLILTCINVGLIVLKKPKYVNLVGIGIVILAGFSVVGTYWVSGHMPVYEKFATLQDIVFIAGLLGVIYNRKPEDQQENINPLWFIILFLQLFILTKGFEINSNYYMYDKSYVVLFFQFRITAMALFVFAFGIFLSLLINKPEKAYQGVLLHRARNFMILGASLYLAGELSGSYWAFLWWGDPWHWSKGFFLSSTMFLLSMLASHLPVNLASAARKKSWVNLLAIASILSIYLISH